MVKKKMKKWSEDGRCQFTDKEAQCLHKYTVKVLSLTAKQEHPNTRKHLQNPNQLISILRWQDYKLAE